MPRYKLRPHPVGEVFRWDDGTESVCVADVREAQRVLYEETGELHPYLHTEIACGQVVYKRMIDAEEELPEDVEPGDTIWWLQRDHGGELRPCEARVWVTGWPAGVAWRMTPRVRALADELPVGTQVHHKRLGDGRTTSKARRRGRQVFIDVEFKSGVRRACTAVRLFLSPYLGNWRPRPLYELSIDSQVIATGSQGSMQALLDVRLTRLRAEWEAENFLDPSWLLDAEPALAADGGDRRV
jgi:hypothetical protein